MSNQTHSSGLFFENGLLQAADLNPALPGLTTQDLTNPNIVMQQEAQARATKEIAAGARFKSLSPLVFIGGAAAVLFALAWLQKKPYFPK
ncbi:MAG: hypothetical protein FWD39_01990 [Clostridiales bacterium]|nr:hypothetical protein [Clostridiales bacterium]